MTAGGLGGYSYRVFMSARDVGNIAAGFIAGRDGMSWFEARLGFDALESWQQGGLSSEAMPTQSAQRVGYRIGNDYFKERLLPVR